MRLKDDTRGELRIALECHTCFDWLMPVMDEFRRRWPEVEVDLVAGFHPDPLALLGDGKADLVIGSQRPQAAALARRAAVPLRDPAGAADRAPPARAAPRRGRATSPARR